jgi:LysR family glycine cleavage system transcriptional activator
MNGIHMRRFRSIPPLQYLVGFEAAARHESFSKAAAELGLTQSTISHEMRLLEERLGQPLFLRHGRAVRLTDAGREYQRTVLRSLDELESGYRRLEPYRKPGSVILYCPSDFAARWLLPRLPLLKAAVPACEPWIDSSGRAIEFDRMEVSIAVLRVRAVDHGLIAHRLFADRLVPVAAPSLLTKPVHRPADLLKHKLIHDERPEGWADWFASAGVAAGDIAAGLDFSDRELALRAAERGLGVALATAALLEVGHKQRLGSLHRAAAHEAETGLSWFAVTTARERDNAVTDAVWRWLVGASTA